MKQNFKTILLLLIIVLQSGWLFSQSIIDLKLIGRYSANTYDEGGAEISAYDAVSRHLFSVNAFTDAVDIIDLGDPTAPALLTSIDLSTYGKGANSVAVYGGILVAAIENFDKQADGLAVFFDADGNYLNSVTVGALPDMITYTPDGSKVLVANEGEPNDAYTVDPLGTVSIIDLAGGVGALTQNDVTTLDFSEYNNQVLDPSIRIFGPNATVAQDLEPEYIAVSNNSERAYVTLQENNAIAVINLTSKKIVKLIGLGFKDHMLPENKLDASDQNGGIINIANWPVYGIYQPDAIDFMRINGTNYLVLANEGDVRDYDGFSEASRVSSLSLDTVAFPDAATLKSSSNMGRLNVTKTMGDLDNDGDYDQLYAFGARSFSIRTTDGNIVFDSGDQIEQITAAAFPANFNCSNSNNTLKNRSDDKGPEPEGIELAEILDSAYAFVGLERIGGVMVYNITDPQHPKMVNYVNTRDFSQTPGLNSGGDLGPEGLLFIPAADSPNGKNLLVVSNEVSGTIGIFETDVLCGPKNVQVCYNNQTFCVGKKQVPALLAQGAVLGACDVNEKSGTGLQLSAINPVIFPNPSTGMFYVNIPEPVIGDVMVKIYNMVGSVVLVSQFDGSNAVALPVNASGLNNGMYFYSVKTSAGEYNGKITITR